MEIYGYNFLMELKKVLIMLYQAAPTYRILAIFYKWPHKAVTFIAIKQVCNMPGVSGD